MVNSGVEDYQQDNVDQDGTGAGNRDLVMTVDINSVQTHLQTLN